MRILTAGGGSGGHVTPVVAVLSELHTKHDGTLEVRFVCDKAFEMQARKIMSSAPIDVPVTVISAGKLRRYRHFSWYHYLQHPMILLRNIVDVLHVGIGVVQSLWLMLRWRPDVVFAKGGYVCLPVGWAARLLRIPLIIHDSDARPGLTNRLLAGSATAIATGYPLDNYPYDKSRSRYVGVPVRPDFSPVSDEQRREARQRLGIADDGTPLILAFGGGLGSDVINSAVLAFAGEQAHGASIMLIAGAKHYDTVRQRVGEDTDRLRVYGFVSTEMPDMLKAADIVVSRASATSLQELAVLEKAIVAVPARQLGDQVKNAEVYAAADAAVVLTDDQLEAGELTGVIATLLEQPARRAELAHNLSQFARPNAASDVADMILSAGAKR